VDNSNPDSLREEVTMMPVTLPRTQNGTGYRLTYSNGFIQIERPPSHPAIFRKVLAFISVSFAYAQ